MASRSRSDAAFKKGDRVEARWSGSNKFYEAKILEATSRSYKVQFDDGSVSSVKMADVKKLKEKEKSEPKEQRPKRQASKSKSRSRSRTRAKPSRSRSRSPARKEKKAPKAKTDKRSSTEDKKSPNNVDEADSPVKSILTRNKIGVKEETKKETVSSSQTSNSFMSKEFYVSLDQPNMSTAQLRTSTRLANFKFAQSSADKDTKGEKANAVKKSDGKYSDEESSDEEVEVVRTPSTRLSLQILYFMLTLSRIIILPLAMLFLIFTCTKKQCTVFEVPQFYSGWRSFGNSIKYPIVSVLAFHVVLCILSLIPAGKKQSGFPTESSKSVRQYCLNGLFCLVIAITAFSAASYFGVYSNWGYDKFKSTSLSSLIYCVCCALIIHIVSLIKGNGDKFSSIPLIGNFYDGVYINPFLFGKIDVKTSFIRAGLIGSALMNASIVLKYFLMKGTVTIPMASTVLMQLIFVLDFFIKEETMLSSATYTMDTVGYSFILTTGFLVPFGLVLDTVYLFNYETRASAVPHYCSALVAVLFLFGYILYRSSNNVKHAFRRNPYGSSASGLESIPTSKKKRLITSGLWGKMRHPNYVGLFIMATAWTLPCGFSHLVPYVPLVMLLVALIVRSFRVERECKEKYGPAWTKYTEVVRKRFIPYVF